LRPLGYAGGITILKERLAELRPAFLAARSYQRTTYLPRELMQLDWWETGMQVTSLPHSAAHAGRADDPLPADLIRAVATLRLDRGQFQHDSWARTVAFERRPRRLTGTVAESWRVERGAFRHQGSRVAPRRSPPVPR